MRDARHISSREVSQGVQRHVLDQTTWFGCTVMAHNDAAPLVFERPTAGSIRRIMDEAGARSRRRPASRCAPGPADSVPRYGSWDPCWTSSTGVVTPSS